MASVRTVRVGGIDYLQVVEYKRTEGQAKVSVIKSFGRATLENKLKAEQFAAEYELLRTIAREQARQAQSKQEVDSFGNLALAVFGIILGATVVIAILKEMRGAYTGCPLRSLAST